jgi:hypothetical protein
MSLKDSKIITLKEIEGAISTHDGFLKKELERKREAYEYVKDVSELADYIGGEVTKLGISEDWAITKEIFPGVAVMFAFDHADEEFPSNLRVFYSGERVRGVHGEDLVAYTLAIANHMLRYIRETNKDKKLPEICNRV